MNPLRILLLSALILVVFSSGCLEEEKISEEKTTEEKEENINAIPKAMISTSVSNVSLHGEEFVFEGTAEDSDGKIVSYEWKSSIDGILSTEIKFTISTLSIGKHNISFRAQDNQSDWSEIDSIDLLVKPNFWGDNCEDVPDEICKVRTAPDFELVDHRNLPVNMSQFIGDIVIINFFYTHSPDTGPATIYQMKKLSESLENKNVTILTITVDPERDTPDRLTDFSQANNASWAFLTSNEDNSSGYMSSIWLNYGIYVSIDEVVCSGHGHYMEGYEGCHCNSGYVQDPSNIDNCVVDSQNGTVENRTIFLNLTYILDKWMNGNISNTSTIMEVNWTIAEYSDANNETYSEIQQIEDYLGHWKQGHISDEDMVEIITSALNYDTSKTDTISPYSISHSSKLYIIDPDGKIRIVWRGIDWSHSSIYHDIEELILEQEAFQSGHL